MHDTAGTFCCVSVAVPKLLLSIHCFALNFKDEAESDVGMLAVDLSAEAALPYPTKYDRNAFIACFDSPCGLTTETWLKRSKPLAILLGFLGHCRRCSSLCRPAETSRTVRPGRVVPAPGKQALFDVAVRLVVTGAPIDLSVINKHDEKARTIVDLPNYS